MRSYPISERAISSAASQGDGHTTQYKGRNPAGFLPLSIHKPGHPYSVGKAGGRFLLFCTISLLCATNTLKHPIPQLCSPDCGREG